MLSGVTIHNQDKWVQLVSAIEKFLHILNLLILGKISDHSLRKNQI